MALGAAHVEGEHVPQMQSVSELHTLVQRLIAERSENLVLHLQWPTARRKLLDELTADFQVDRGKPERLADFADRKPSGDRNDDGFRRLLESVCGARGRIEPNEAVLALPGEPFLALADGQVFELLVLLLQVVR